MFAVLHFVADQDDPAALIDGYMTPMPPGSYLACTHITDEFPDAIAALRPVYAEADHGVYPRSPCQIEALATTGGLTLVPPGIVRVTDWHPPDPLRPPARQMWLFGGLAQKTTRAGEPTDGARPGRCAR